MTQEIELKLELTPDAADALIASGLLAGEPAVAELRSVYFDTPGRDLSSAGFSLRIREKGDRRVQTVKAAGTAAAGLFARPEWERALDGDRPVLDDTTPIRAMLGDKVRDVCPAFEVRVERRSWTLKWEKAEIELALDRGEVAAGERRAPVCEVELELKKGPPAALFSFARRIDAAVPVKVGVVNKAERGFRLLGPASGFVKSEPLALSPEMSAADAFRRIAGACLRQFRLNEALLGHRNAEAVHQARVALRRLRSAFSIFRPMLEDSAFQRLRGETRWLANALADARDLDVLIARDRADDALRAHLDEARATAYDRAGAALSSRRARTFMLDLSEWLALGGWLTQEAGRELRAAPVRDFAVSALDRYRRKVKKGGRDLAELADEARHEVRKDAKKLRYAAEFFAPLFDDKRRRRRAKRFVAALAELQESLGALNDLAVAGEVLVRFGLEDHPGAAELLDVHKSKRDLAEAAAEAHDAFLDAKPFWR